MLYEVIPTKLFRQDSNVLTYSSDAPLKPGHIVLIPLGRSTTPGIVLRKAPVQQVDFPVKPITKLLYDTPLPHHLLSAATWLSDYYLAPLPTIANLLLPTGVTKKRRGKVRAVNEDTIVESISLGRPQRGSARFSADESVATDSSDAVRENVIHNSIPLNASQRRALADLAASPRPTKLLHGITGSGKTNIYLTLTAQTLTKNRSVILLVPEIALTSQLVSVFEQTFPGQTTLIHSKQTESKRHLIWESILNATHPQIVIGPRSALFAPLKNLGLIIIDEAHESAYFQENTPKYSAVRLASYIASHSSITCLLGTATPLISDYYLANRNQSLISLTAKAKTTATVPDIHLIDLKDQTLFTKNRYFSNPLLQQISANLTHHHQTLIFHNRRGSAPLTICEKCGWQALCPTCFLPLTLHTDTYELICHTCGLHTQVPTKCPSCGHLGIIHKGFGTKLLESELKKLFPKAKIARFDADNTKETTLDAQYQAVKTGDIDILIGTQTLARGLDLPHLATVGVVQADAGLSLPDYASEERTFHLLTQVLGRIGRGHIDVANAFIQTYQPNHPIITAACRSDYDSFYQYLLNKRHQSHLPPYRFLAKLSVTYKTEATTVKYIRQLHRQLSSFVSTSSQTRATSSAKTSPRSHLYLSTPTPAFHERTTAGFTWQIILSSPSRNLLLSALKSLPTNAHFHYVIDPPSLLS